MAITKSWLEDGRTDWQSVLLPPATLIAENDGAGVHGRAHGAHAHGAHPHGAWHRLAVYRVAGPTPRYLVCVQSFTHLSKEPCEVARLFGSAVQAAAFLIAYAPPTLVPAPCRHTWAATERERRLYDHQLHAVLCDLDSALGIFVR